MIRRRLLLHLLPAVFLAGGLVSHLSAQAPQLRPVSVGSPMADFTLPILQGGDFTLSDYHGKRVMLVFPRGLSGPTSWCHVCPYQHAELMEYDTAADFRANSNMEILFVLPYESEKVDEWVNAFPTLLQDIEDWKNPEDPAALDDRGRARMERVRQLFPNTFQVEPEDVRNSFPILVDADHAVASGLGIFTTNWSGSEADQNIPTILIVDENGILLFKYMSQNTMDRPPLEYLVRFMEVLSELGS